MRHFVFSRKTFGVLGISTSTPMCMPSVAASMKKGLWSPDAGALFLPLDMPVTAGVPVAQAPVAELPPPVAVELRLRGGRSLHFESTIDPAALSALIRVVDAA